MPSARLAVQRLWPTLLLPCEITGPVLPNGVQSTALDAVGLVVHVMRVCATRAQHTLCCAVSHLKATRLARHAVGALSHGTQLSSRTALFAPGALFADVQPALVRILPGGAPHICIPSRGVCSRGCATLCARLACSAAALICIVPRAARLAISLVTAAFVFIGAPPLALVAPCLAGNLLEAAAHAQAAGC